MLVGVACSLLESPQPPALLLLRLSQTEQPLLLHGPGSPEADAAFARADDEIARLFACLRRGPARDSAALLIVGDRGSRRPQRVRPEHRARQGRPVDARPGARHDDRHAVVGDRAQQRRQRLRYAQKERDAVLARSALAAEAARYGTFRVVAADELLRGGADPEAWFGLEAEPGFLFRRCRARSVPGAGRDPRRGGYLPSRAEMDTGFVAWGRGLRTRVRIPRMKRPTSAPTAARLLGVDLGEVSGRPLIGALDLPPG